MINCLFCVQSSDSFVVDVAVVSRIRSSHTHTATQVKSSTAFLYFYIWTVMVMPNGCCVLRLWNSTATVIAKKSLSAGGLQKIPYFSLVTKKLLF